MVVLEAMSESTPVITSRVGDHESTVVDSMLIFDIADSVGLAHSMNHVLSLEPSQYMDLQERTLDLYKLQFSSEIWVRNHLDIYRKI
jgi:glycosyltransferase involved in cell wall biosynthesis